MAEKVFRAAVLVVSDRVSRGDAEDRSGTALAERAAGEGFEVVQVAVVADDPQLIIDELRRLSRLADLVLTTGGTGLGPRDRTPEATAAAADYLVPGLAEEMRRAGRAGTPLALLSRGVAGVMGATLVLNLPGSPRGAIESLDAVMETIPHALKLLAGDTEHPA